MAIEIKETFEVQAPIEKVWRFLLDPAQVVTCMPGAALDEIVDARTFHGTVKVKVGAITTSYKGKVQLVEVDEGGYRLQMVAEGRETGGGTAKGTMQSTLRTLAGGTTEVVGSANVDLTGRIMQVGRGMIQGVSHQLFLQFVARTKERLETAEAASAPGSAPGADGGAATARAVPAAPADNSIRIVPIVLHVVWTAIVRFFRRLLGRG
jgi:carbon monoxide dehydrogenase subunit G